MPQPLLIFDTNILLDLLLGRDGDQAVLLVELAEAGRVELVVPEYVLFEFRGTALRLIRDETQRLHAVRSTAKEWARYQELGAAAEAIRTAAKQIDAKVANLSHQVEAVVTRLRSVAHVPVHTQEIHFRGDLRYLSGRPPDRPVDGIKDCRIYEAVLEFVKADAANTRPRYLLTRDGDFDVPELIAELTGLGVTLRNDPGRLFGELR